MSNDGEKIAELQRKIQTEKALISGAMQMRNSTNNAAVQSQVDNQIRENRRNIDYFEGLARELQTRQMGDMSLNNNGSARPPSHGSGPSGYRNGPAPSPYGAHAPHGSTSSGYGDPGPGGYQDQLAGGNMNMPARAPFPPGGPAGSSTGSIKGRPTYTRLDLIKYDTAHLGPRIQLMLSQLEFKLSVEKQYKDGVEKIMGSYNIDGDKKIRREAESRRIESIQKIQLLQRALKKYEALHVDVESSLDPTDDDSINAPSMRKPLTGRLSLRVNAVSDVNHASRGKTSRGPETFVIMKVEDDFKGRTKATRTDRWTDELHDIFIDKGNEIELTVYDKAGGDHPLPVGMVWIRISDIAEEMRRKKIETEFNNSGWVSADRTMEDGSTVRPDIHFNPPPGSSGGPGGMMGGAAFNAGLQGMAESQPVVIDAWFSLEPVGRIHLAMSFEKQTRERMPLEGLNRKGAIRQRKEDVHELYGHKFVSQQFYNIMRCALCGELLKYATGMQCADCKYMCHEKCYSLVVTKCITKSNAESDPDEAKLNHRIPHRFEPFANMGANWCCHCGYMLPLGRKNCRRCKECKLTCHTQCTHLVPDFCGMSMKDANRILGEIKNVASQKPKTLRPPGKAAAKARPAPNQEMSYQRDPQEIQAAAAQGRWSYGTDMPGSSAEAQQQQQQGQSQPQSQPYVMQPVNPPPSAASLSAASIASNTYPSQPPSSYQQQQQQQQKDNRRPGATRQDSSTMASAAAASAAASALAGKGRGSPATEQRPSYYSRTSSGYGSQQQADRAQQPTSPTPAVSSYNPQDYVNFDRGYGAPQPAQQPVATPQPAYQTSASGAPQIPAPGQPASASTFIERKNDPPPSQDRGSRRRIGLDHFNFLAVLGKGNFGKVMLAETKSTKQLYAIKVLKKEFIIENDEVESTKSERDVFIIANKARHPFLTNLHACFQTETRVYFVMEYISGGDLMWHIQRGQFGTKRAQYYAAEVCLALKYFHENGVVYRDLKLDNIMLTLDGHIKVADYGLCKKDMYYGSTTSTFCGTPEFMAPEILLDKKYGRAVDWWAFGVLIYQMLLQQSPFRGEDEDEIYDAILADEPLYPIHMPRDSVSILQKLLTREPELRLGSGPTDAQEIMAHPFFRNINWQEILEKKIPPPFLPQIKSATDTSNFDQEFTSVTPVLTPVQSVLSQAMQEEFRGFSYSADFV